MTYGWAILIIVIVAVILYSMGIFNPSSSITFTSSGFSPFTVSSSLCNNIGYKIAVLAGPIPNNANSLTINKVYLTSATGANTTTASYTLTNPVTLKSGQSATILIPNVACNSANTHYSLSAKIQYSYDVPTIGLQTVNTTGTVAGTSITGKPSTLTSYEPITITNTQSSATPSPFQQMVNFTSSDPGFSSIATGNFGQNVEFFYYNGTVIPSWLENYTSTNAIWWLKIAAIPAGSSETVYVGFAPTSTSLFNTVNDGEAPQLTCPNPSATASCSTYAEYDDGIDVFNFYDNFAGTTLNTNKWTNEGITYTVNNGFTATSTASSGYIYSPVRVTPPYIIEFYGDLGGQSTDTTAETGGMMIPAVNGGNFWGVAIGSGWPTSGNYLAQMTNGGAISTAVLSDAFLNAVLTINIVNSTTSTYYYNSLNKVTVNADAPKYPVNLMLIGAPANGAAYSFSPDPFIQWFSTRAYPPNGVMPSVTFGSVV